MNDVKYKLPKWAEEYNSKVDASLEKLRNMSFEQRLVAAQEDSKRLDASERVCCKADKFTPAGHEGEVFKAYNKGSGHIEWFCETCIGWFDSIVDPYYGKNGTKGLHPDYLACFEISTIGAMEIRVNVCEEFREYERELKMNKGVSA